MVLCKICGRQSNEVTCYECYDLSKNPFVAMIMMQQSMLIEIRKEVEYIIALIDKKK